MPDELPAAPVAAEPIAAPVTPAAAVASPDPPPIASPATDGTGAAAAPIADAAPAKDAPAAPVKDFAPSLLDEAAKQPTADAKPPEPASKDATPAADAKPSDTKEPAADAAKPDPAKPADQAKPAEPPAPIEYTFTVADPEGKRIPIAAEMVDPERLGAFTGILNEARVPPEAAQKMVDLHLGELTRAVEQRDLHQWEVFHEQQIKSQKEVMADEVLGGSRHDTAMRTVVSAIDAFTLRDQNTKAPRSADAIAAERKQLYDDFKATGIANRLPFLRFMHWVGDTYVREGQARPAPPPRGENPNAAQRGTGRYRNTTPAAR